MLCDSQCFLFVLCIVGFCAFGLPFADAKTFAFRSFPAKCVAEFYVAHNIEFLVRRKKCGENQ